MQRGDSKLNNMVYKREKRHYEEGRKGTLRWSKREKRHYAEGRKGTLR